MRFIKDILGILTYGAAALFLIYGILAPFVNSDYSLATNLFGSCFFLAIAGGFSRLGKWLMKEPEALQAETQVSQIKNIETQDLQSIFYELIQKNQGSMTVMQLAIAAGITGEDSKAYLEQQVKQFHADFDVTETGTLVYKFPV